VQIQTTNHAEIVAVRVSESRLDYSNVNDFKNAMLALVDDGGKRFAIDMGAVEFMDSRGLSALLSLHRALGGQGAIALYDVRDSLRKVFAVTKTQRILQVCPTLEDALARLQG